MFIKQAYERRQMQQDGDQEILSTEQRLHKIGSIRNNKVNYDKDEQFFSKEEIPQKALQIKEEVQTFIDPDILGLRKKEWNSSVSVPKNPLSEETHERKLVKIRLGLFDHPIPKEKPNKIYQGVETRDNYLESLPGSDKWNVSVDTCVKEQEKQLFTMTQKAQQMTKSKQEDIIRNYITPLDYQTKLTLDLRTQKLEEKDIREAIRSEYKNAHPAACKQAIDGAVFRLAYEKKLSKDQEKIQDKNYTFKPDMTRTLKQELNYRFIHNGVWQKMLDGDEGWSCCMNGEMNSQGCIRIKIDKNKWDYSSFTH